jgi:adenylylsulfate kinase-like enzyme
VPGLQAAYEVPEKPEVVLHGDRDAPEDAARSVITKLAELGYV